VSRFPRRTATEGVPPFRTSAARLVILGVLLAACQPLPQPFADDRPPPGDSILALKDGAGLRIDKLAGVSPELAARFGEALVKAFEAIEIPATTGSGNRGSYVLIGLARQSPLPSGRMSLELDWDLRTPDGTPAGTHRQQIEAFASAWQGGDPRLLETLAGSTAPSIAALLQNDMPVAAQGAEFHVVVRQVAGAPGDGPRALSRAMAQTLRHANYDAEVEAGKPDPRRGAYSVACRVSLTDSGPKQQKVKIGWILFAPNGAEIGHVDQENTVPKGSLDHAWGDIAFAVATAAADGIVALLEHLKMVQAGGQ
jgi:hypothetical protein